MHKVDRDKHNLEYAYMEAKAKRRGKRENRVRRVTTSNRKRYKRDHTNKSKSEMVTGERDHRRDDHDRRQ